jgi:hypothetical protein
MELERAKMSLAVVVIGGDGGDLLHYCAICW